MTRLLICAPLAIEARAIRRGLPTGVRDVTVVRTGFGARRTGRRRVGSTSWLVPDCGVVAVAGFGGALDPTLVPGDVLVATEVWFGERRLPCVAAEPLARELTRAGVPARIGPLVTTDHLVWELERRRLSRTGAGAVDMESGPLVAAAAGLPVTVVRAIVDTPDRPLLSPASLIGGLAARRALRCVGPALVSWSREIEAASTSRAAPSEEGRS
jgi:4-hydroxy-3-methylbut-2-enyl diphosphate reductase